ncbi:hypothetical protein VaNZ11_014448 [Volvox africanus]|uniref:Uncharacterized protein n=1 Tax=Volvox africanus TaxID=51714 RepID=A0ABQ5SJH2_9CHLO|nr:hypothetical protein VaNZ11_014448 [Volvox africanus]
MDLERFIGNRELLERLSREYELLKASGADVDYAAWVRQRLRDAAAELAAASIGADTRNGDIQRSDSYEILADGAAPTTAISGQSTLPEVAPTVDIPGQQLAFSRRSGPAGAPIPATLLDKSGAAPTKPENAWFLHGEGTDPASGALATAIYGPSAQLSSVTAPTFTRAVKGSRNKASKRVVIISPRKSPLQPPQRTSPNQSRQQQHSVQSSPPMRKLFMRVESGPFPAKPNTYVHPQLQTRPQPLRILRSMAMQVRAHRTPSAVMRPDWVNAASLQAALRGASSAIPHLQAAAARERRLALSTALARQTLAAGLGQDEARAVVLYGSSPTTAAAQAAQYDHVLQVARQLAQQNEQLALAVQLNSAQLAQQQATLESALQQQPQQQRVPNQAATVSVGQEPAGTVASSAKVGVGSGPPRWSLREGSAGPAVAYHQGKGDFLVTKFTHAPPVSNAGTSKSPKKAGTRSRSPAMLAMAAAMSTGAASISTTAAERERSSRRDALKALLKQVLGSAGLAGGQEGRRRLATSMAEAEKLVAAIHTLARTKAGLDGTGDREVAKTAPQAVRALAVAETQTSRPVSMASGGVEGAPEAATGTQARTSRQISHSASLVGSHSAASNKDATSAGTAPGPSSRSPSRQGSGLTSGSAGSEPQSAAGSGMAPGDQALPSVPATRTGSLGPSETGAPSNSASEEGLRLPGNAKDVGFSSASSSTAREASVRTASLASSPAAQRSQTALIPEGSKRTSASKHSEATTTTSAKASKPSDSAAARAQAPSKAAGGVARGTLPLQGIMVESLEEQVQRIVERDAAAAAEAVRLQKLDALEQRLHSMVNRVETKFARVLQPIQLHAQQAGTPGPSAWGLHPSAIPSGIKGSAEVGPEPNAAARATGEASLTAVAAAVAAAAGAGSGVGSSHSDVPGAGPARLGPGFSSGNNVASTAEIMSPRSAGMSVLELQRMLIDLNRMESKEQEIRRKWFFDSKASQQQRGHVAHPIVVRDGQLSTLDPDDLAAAPPPLPLAPHSGRAISPRPIHRSIPQPPTESALATIALDISRRTLGGPSTGPLHNAAVGSSGFDALSVQAQDGTVTADQALGDPISDTRLESVLRGRRRFLRAQKLADGDLLEAAVPSVNPVQIMEDLTDALLDELLHEQAQDLAGLCDHLGERMFMEEFDLSDDDERR